MTYLVKITLPNNVNELVAEEVSRQLENDTGYIPSVNTENGITTIIISGRQSSMLIEAAKYIISRNASLTFKSIDLFDPGNTDEQNPYGKWSKI